jgi:tetratricopeptide (TPR) repeat protein
LTRTQFQSLALLSRASLVFLVLSIGFSLAQNSLEQLRQNLDNGYYASAAQISGPAAIREDPDNPEAYFLYSKALYYTENFPLARIQFDKAMSLTSNPTPDYIHLNGLITAAEGNLTEAVTLLETAFLRSQNYVMAMDWGRIAWQAGDFDMALKAYEAASTTEGGQKELAPHLNRGRILQLSKGDYEGAITAYKTAITIFEENDPGGNASVPPGVVEENDPSDDVPVPPGPVPPGVVEAYFRLGEIYESLGDAPLAKSYYEVAVSLDRNYTPAQNALTRLLRNP